MGSTLEELRQVRIQSLFPLDKGGMHCRQRRQYALCNLVQHTLQKESKAMTIPFALHIHSQAGAAGSAGRCNAAQRSERPAESGASGSQECWASRFFWLSFYALPDAGLSRARNCALTHSGLASMSCDRISRREMEPCVTMGIDMLT